MSENVHNNHQSNNSDSASGNGTESSVSSSQPIQCCSSSSNLVTFTPSSSSSFSTSSSSSYTLNSTAEFSNSSAYSSSSTVSSLSKPFLVQSLQSKTTDTASLSSSIIATVVGGCGGGGGGCGSSSNSGRGRDLRDRQLISIGLQDDHHLLSQSQPPPPVTTTTCKVEKKRKRNSSSTSYGSNGATSSIEHCIALFDPSADEDPLLNSSTNVEQDLQELRALVAANTAATTTTAAAISGSGNTDLDLDSDISESYIAVVGGGSLQLSMSSTSSSIVKAPPQKRHKKNNSLSPPPPQEPPLPPTSSSSSSLSSSLASSSSSSHVNCSSSTVKKAKAEGNSSSSGGGQSISVISSKPSSSISSSSSSTTIPILLTKSTHNTTGKLSNSANNCVGIGGVTTSAEAVVYPRGGLNGNGGIGIGIGGGGVGGLNLSGGGGHKDNQLINMVDGIDCYGGDESEHARLESFEARFLVSSRDAGAIIGRGGCNITHLRTTYDASITVPDCPSPERVLTIVSSLEKIPKIIREVLKYIDNFHLMQRPHSLSFAGGGGGGQSTSLMKSGATNTFGSGSGNIINTSTTKGFGGLYRSKMDLMGGFGSSGSSGSFGSNSDLSKLDNRNGNSEIRLLLHTSHAGGVIGKAGMRITQLREETQAGIKVYSDCAPTSSERVCVIYGPPEVVVSAVKAILYLITTFPIKGPNLLYDPRNYDQYLAPMYGGYSLEPNSGSGGNSGGHNNSGTFAIGSPPSPGGLDGSTGFHHHNQQHQHHLHQHSHGVSGIGGLGPVGSGNPQRNPYFQSHSPPPTIPTLTGLTGRGSVSSSSISSRRTYGGGGTGSIGFSSGNGSGSGGSGGFGSSYGGHHHQQHHHHSGLLSPVNGSSASSSSGHHHYQQQHHHQSHSRFGGGSGGSGAGGGYKSGGFSSIDTDAIDLFNPTVGGGNSRSSDGFGSVFGAAGNSNVPWSSARSYESSRRSSASGAVGGGGAAAAAVAAAAAAAGLDMFGSLSPDSDAAAAAAVATNWLNYSATTKSWNNPSSTNILTQLLSREDVTLISNSDGSTTATISVPHKIVGAIIGRGGCRISEIRQKTRAEISIGQMKSSSNNRLVTVKGFVNDVQNACLMILKCIDENPC